MNLFEDKTRTKKVVLNYKYHEEILYEVVYKYAPGFEIKESCAVVVV